MAIRYKKTNKKSKTKSKVKTSVVDSKELFSRTQQRAYELYEKRECVHGNDWDDWFEAERQVKAEFCIK